jgi:hypothetical protein
MTDSSGQGYSTPQGFNDATSDFNVWSFMIQQALARVRTAGPVRVMAVTNNGGVSPVGFVDVQPLVNQMNGGGQTMPHGTVFHLPYIRVQGGTNAVIIDPVVGDIGLAVICDRDISSVKANQGQANPGSRRKFSLADGIYIGGILNGTPVCYIQFIDGGMTLSPDSGVTQLVVTPGKIQLNAAEVNLHGTSKITFDADGTGFVYTPSLISTYTDGVATTHSAPTPPEVPT